MNLPSKINIKLESEVFNSFRCQVAANSLDIDVKKKSIHNLNIDSINIPKEWNIGLIYGASGSGKTTLVTELFGKDVFDLIGGNADTIDVIRTGTLRRIKDLSGFNENTMAAYMSIFSRLLGE